MHPINPIYSSMFCLELPASYPDIEKRLDTLINYYFQKYEYIEVNVEYSEKVPQYLKFFHGIMHTKCVHLTFYKGDLEQQKKNILLQKPPKFRCMGCKKTYVLRDRANTVSNNVDYCKACYSQWMDYTFDGSPPEYLKK